MSRLAKKSLMIPKGITVGFHPDSVEIKGAKETVYIKITPQIKVFEENSALHVQLTDEQSLVNSKPMLGTVWSLLKSTLTGISEGFKLTLELVGVGYRAAVQGNKINLTLGFSHPVVFNIPKGVTAETPSQTEIVLSSNDKQLLGQVAAEIRSYRFPECYKGKGIKFSGEVIKIKETKKK